MIRQVQILKLDRPPGFTLVELLVSMGIGLAVLAAVAGTFITQSKYFNVQEQINEMQQNARGAMDIMVREIKMAGYKPAGGTFNGVTYNTSQLVIEADLDASGAISTASTSNEQITYAHDDANKQVTRKIGTGTAQVLADNITAFTFQYLDVNGAATTVTANIRQVRLNITARTARRDPDYSPNDGYRTYRLTAVVTPPNLAY